MSSQNNTFFYIYGLKCVWSSFIKALYSLNMINQLIYSSFVETLTAASRIHLVRSKGKTKLR